MYTETIVTDIHDVDAAGNIRPACLLRYLQSAANGQMRAFGPSNEQLRADDRAFLVSRMLVVYHRAVRPYETLTASARACGGKGLRFSRCGALADASGACVVEFASVWAFVRISDRKLLPLSAFHPGFTDDPPLLADESLRVTIPHDAVFTDCGTYTVSYRDVDQNGHMNNTVYPDLLMGYLPIPAGARISRMAICFFGEAVAGSTFTVLRTPAPDGWYVRTVRADGSLGVEVQFSLADA